MVSKKMLFALLWCAGMMGVLSLLWINPPIPEGDLPLPVIKLLNLISPTFLLSIAVLAGITEEIMLRWGLLTVLVWLLWRFLQKAEGTPNVQYVVLAITISALIFGLAHLPLAFALSPQVTTPLTIYIVAGNTLFGLISGYLYWQKGLESAIIAHMVFHVVIVTLDSWNSYKA